MKIAMDKVGFIMIKESDYKKLKENGELEAGFYLIERDNQEGKEEDELGER